MYADTVTASMKTAIAETERRRALQAAYNAAHGITPESVVREIDDVLSSVYERDYGTGPLLREPRETFRTQAELDAEITRLEGEMKSAAANLDFERAAALRDRLKTLRSRELGLTGLSAGPSTGLGAGR
jgi:excinuclease ABC subunit B